MSEFSKPIPTVDEVLEAMETEWTPDRYCRHTLARNADGYEVEPYDPSAVKFCAYGFLNYATFDHRGFTPHGGPLEHIADYDMRYEFYAAHKEEYQAVAKVYEEAVTILEAAIPCGRIDKSNDTPNGHTNILNAVRKARAKRAKELAAVEVQ